MNGMTKKILVLGIGLFLTGVAAVTIVLVTLSANLPKMITVEDYRPLLVSQVYSRSGEKIGEFFREKRVLVPMDKIPDRVIHAFVAAEDSAFYEHHGINVLAIIMTAVWIAVIRYKIVLEDQALATRRGVEAVG